jgi:hypothetical protein
MGQGGTVAVELVTTKDTTAPEMVELFSIDGKSYSIPAKPKFNIVLRYMKVVREEGSQAAEAYLLEELLGEEGFEALCSYEDLTAEQFEAVKKVATKVVLGDQETGKGR